MSQRSPMNPRYQKGTEPKGQTRRSAASAKPKRDSAPVGRTTKGSSSGSSGEKRSVKDRYADSVPANPLYKTYRRIWWATLGIALVALVISLAMSFEPMLSWGGETGVLVSSTLSYAALGLIAYSWYLDLKKIRPIMKDWGAMSPKDRAAARAAVEADRVAADSAPAAGAVPKATTPTTADNPGSSPVTGTEDEESDQ